MKKKRKKLIERYPQLEVLNLHWEDFKHLEWILALSAFAVTLFIVVIGNPRIENTILSWHHIPELVAFFFLGCWISRIGKPFGYVFLLYAIESVLTPFIVIPWEYIYLYGIIYVFALAISAPLLIGFLIHRKLFNINIQPSKV